MNKTSLLSGLFALFFAATTILFWQESNRATEQKDVILKTHNQLITDITVERDAARAAANTAEAERNESKQKANDLAKQLEATRTAASEITASSNTKIADLKKQLDEATARLEELKRESEGAKTDAASARKDADEIAKSLSEERDRIEKLTAENVRLREEPDAVALRKENTEIKSELQRIRNTDAGRAFLQIEDRNKIIVQREATITERDETIDRQNKHIAELDDKIKELNDKLDAALLDAGRGPRKSKIADRHGI
jgi:uncharacterized protein (DUF3084 family)